MSFRPLLLAVPPAVLTAAGLALATPCLGGRRQRPDDDLLRTCPGHPAAPPPPAGGGTERRGDRMATVNPKAFCLDRVARRAGNRTYLKIRSS